MAVIGDSFRLAEYEDYLGTLQPSNGDCQNCQDRGDFRNLGNLAILTLNQASSSLAVAVPPQDAAGPNGDRA
jgi:hypothetical protein